MIPYIDNFDKSFLIGLQNVAYSPFWGKAFSEWNEFINSPLFKILVLALTLYSLRKFLKKKKYNLVWIIVAGYSFDRLIHFLKAFIGRPRPDFLELGLAAQQQCLNSGGYSFPSGHASITFFLLSIVFDKDSKLKYFWGCLGLMVLVPRVYCGIHYVSDIIAGAILGTIFGLFVKNRLFSIEKLND